MCQRKSIAAYSQSPLFAWVITRKGFLGAGSGSIRRPKWLELSCLQSNLGKPLLANLMVNFEITGMEPLPHDSNFLHAPFPYPMALNGIRVLSAVSPIIPNWGERVRHRGISHITDNPP